MIDLKAAEERNQWFATHWHDGIPLEILGVDIADALKYNMLDVLGRLWLQYAQERHAAEAKAAAQPSTPPAENVLTVDDVVKAAQTLAAAAGLSADDVLQALNAARDQKAAAVAPQPGAVALDDAPPAADSQAAPDAPPGASTGDAEKRIDDDDKRIDNGGADGAA